MDSDEHILDLIRKALGALEGDTLPLSAVIQKCIRIARLRDDYLNLWWLELEMHPVVRTDKPLFEDPPQFLREVAAHLAKEEILSHHEEVALAWVEEREVSGLPDAFKEHPDDNVFAWDVGQIEVQLQRYTQAAQELRTPQGLHADDLYSTYQSTTEARVMILSFTSGLKTVLQRIRKRVHNFLTRTEKQLMFGQLHSDIFERYRQFVDRRLGEECPDALAKLVVAHRRVSESDPESWAQALASCRRVLKSLADALYPPTDKSVVGDDGKTHVLTEERYLARLWQYICEKTPQSVSGAELGARVQDFGKRIDRLYKLACKGVHSEITSLEVDQCVIQTYLIAGDLLSLSGRPPASAAERAHSDTIDEGSE